MSTTINNDILMKKDKSKIELPPLQQSMDPTEMAQNNGHSVQPEKANSSSILPDDREIADKSAAHVKTEQKTLPITKLGNTWFGVDIDKRLFIKIGVPDHSISFDHMIYKGDHYEMSFDLFKEAPPRRSSLNNEDVVMLKLPQLVEMAPIEMSKKYAIPAHELLKLSDFEVMVNQIALGERVKGVLPTYEILDTKYKVDLDNYCFRSGRNRIPMNDFTLVSDPYGERYSYMDANTHRVVKIDIMSIKEMPPENIVKVVIPCNDKLDPYHVGKNREPDLNTYLLAHPMVSGQKATIIPLSQTNIPAIIESNVKWALRWQFEQTQRLNARKLRNGIK
jgi:hypothetical protein